MWVDKTGRLRRRSSTRVISTSVEQHDEIVYAPDGKPGTETTEYYVPTLKDARPIRGSKVLPKWCRYLLCATCAVAIGFLLARLGCGDGREVCGDRWTGPLSVSGAAAMLVFAAGLWRLSAAEIDAIVAGSGTGRAVLAGMLPMALGVLSLGIGFIAGTSDISGADTVETVGWSIAGAFGLATFGVRRRRKPRLLTLPAYRLPRSN